jgi:hypothetical protein
MEQNTQVSIVEPLNFLLVVISKFLLNKLLIPKSKILRLLYAVSCQFFTIFVKSLIL